MDGTAPTKEEMEKLLEAALAFKQQAPWQWMWDAQIWGIRNPETGQIGYASVMGQLGEHLALAVYHGSEGLHGWYRLSQNEEPDNPTILYEIPHLQASFEDRERLTDKDRQVIKSLGLKFRGRQEWPRFRSYVPGYVDWYVTGEEARFLTLALRQTVEMAPRLKADPMLLEPRGDHFLVRTRTEQGWVEEWLALEPLPPSGVMVLDEADADRLKQHFASRIKKVEVDMYGLTVIRNDRDARPYVGYHFMVVESEQGLILGSDLLVADPSFEDMWMNLPNHLLKTITHAGILPKDMAVRSERIAFFLAPLAEQLNIRLKVAKRLPALDRARPAYDRMLG
jgi:hypothetical protein